MFGAGYGTQRMDLDNYLDHQKIGCNKTPALLKSLGRAAAAADELSPVANDRPFVTGGDCLESDRHELSTRLLPKSYGHLFDAP